MKKLLATVTFISFSLFYELICKRQTGIVIQVEKKNDVFWSSVFFEINSLELNL